MYIVRILSSVSVLILICVGWARILCKKESGCGFCKRCPGSDFINVVQVRTLSRIESGSWSGVYWCRPGPDYINQSPGVSPDVSVVRFRILSIFSPGQASPGPCPGLDFSQCESESGVFQHPEEPDYTSNYSL